MFFIEFMAQKELENAACRLKPPMEPWIFIISPYKLVYRVTAFYLDYVATKAVRGIEQGSLEFFWTFRALFYFYNFAGE